VKERGPFSRCIFVRYLPHVSTFVLVYLMAVSVRPKHVAYLVRQWMKYKKVYVMLDC